MTDYSVLERSTTVAAPPDVVMALLEDFHEWVKWSPWEGLDPQLQRTYTGPDAGLGAAYEWSGNRKAGAGRMEIVNAEPESLDIDLKFTKPFPSNSAIRFDLTPSGDHTSVVWQMRTPNTVGMRLARFFMNLDKAIGKDLVKGLDGIKRVVESG
jgi:carbon monoxide dehydrogenase subunit G